MPDAPKRMWACDLTQFKVGGGMMHTVFIIDLFSRFAVGWGLLNTGDAELCLKALRRACRNHGCPAVFHSDKGSQFTSRRFMAELRKRRIRQCMTGPRGWKDNVYVERFIWCIKNEWSMLHEWTWGSQARGSIAELICHYNFVRDYGPVGSPPAEAQSLSK